MSLLVVHLAIEPDYSYGYSGEKLHVIHDNQMSLQTNSLTLTDNQHLCCELFAQHTIWICWCCI